MTQLRTPLKEAGLEFYDWSDTGNTDSPRHLAAAYRMIAASRSAIIIISDEYFKPQPNSKICVQKLEVEKILDETRRRDFQVVLVILQNAEGAPDVDAVEAHIQTHYPDLQMKNLQAKGVRNGTAARVASTWKPALQEVASELAQWIGAAEEREKLKKTAGELASREETRDTAVDEAAPSSPPSTAAKKDWNATRFAATEHSYLEVAIESWREGRGGKGSQKADSSGPFSFHPGRFISLKAREIGSAVSAREGDNLHPISKWLFSSEQHRPYIIRGRAGCGHSCTLAVTAALLGSQFDASFAGRTSEIPKQLRDDAQALAETTKYFPIFMRAKRIADILDAAPTLSSANAVFAAIAARLSANTDDTPTHQEMLTRMRVQPYALFVDELDRLSAKDEPRVLRALSDAYDALNTAGRPLKIIACGQRVGSERVTSVVDIELQRLDTPQRMAFFKQYAETVSDVTVDDIVNAADAFPGGADAFDTPVLLSAFCWGVSKPELRLGDSKGQTEFYDLIVENLLAAPLAQAQSLPDKDTLLRILRRLAFIGLSGPIEDDEVERIIEEFDISAPKETLRFLTEKTALLERRPSAFQRYVYSVRSVFGDYLAAREIAASHADPQILRHLSGAEAARTWRRAIAFTAPQLLDKHDEKRAIAFLDALRRRGEASKFADDQAGWFRCVASGLASLASIRGDPTPARQAAIDQATSTLKSARAWTPKQRSDAIAELSVAVRHPRSATKTRAAVDALRRSLLGVTEYWVSIPKFKHPGGDSSFKIAATPLLVAEYAEYVEDRAARSLAEDTSVSPLGGSGRNALPETGADIWAEISGIPFMPVVGLTFQEAADYCDWLNENMRTASNAYGELGPGEIIRLPTTVEWDAIAKAVCNSDSPYWWGDQDPCEGNESRVNWRGANIGAPTAPGAFAPYISSGLYDLGSNVAVRTTPHRADGDPIWPPQLAPEEKPEVRGANFASQINELPYSGERATPKPQERWRTTGVRLVKTKCKTGWS